MNRLRDPELEEHFTVEPASIEEGDDPEEKWLVVTCKHDGCKEAWDIQGPPMSKGDRNAVLQHARQAHRKVTMRRRHAS